MNEELYAHDKYLGHNIFTTLDHGKYWSDIYHNGTNLITFSAYSYEKVIKICSEWIDRK